MDFTEFLSISYGMVMDLLGKIQLMCNLKKTRQLKLLHLQTLQLVHWCRAHLAKASVC